MVEMCSWKLVDPEDFVIGIEADRCGKHSEIRIIRPNRKKDLFLCEDHLNCFIEKWGLHYNVEILCRGSE